MVSYSGLIDAPCTVDPPLVRTDSEQIDVAGSLTDTDVSDSDMATPSPKVHGGDVDAVSQLGFFRTFGFLHLREQYVLLLLRILCGVSTAC